MDFDFTKILDPVKNIFDAIVGFFDYIFSGRVFLDWIIISIDLGVNSITFLLDLLPDLPTIPDDLYKNLISFLDIPFTSGAVGFIGWIFGGWTVLSFVIFVSLSVFMFRLSYDIFIFIITKLPLGVKR